MIQAYFLSDIHIKSVEESNSEKLLLFLHELQNDKDCTHLFLVGDIFDLWIYNHSYFLKKYARLIDGIRGLVRKGIEVHYFEGNHDLYLRKFWQQDVGVQVHEGPYYFSLGKWVVRVEHGDFMNPEDKGYLFLRKLLRSLPVKTLAKNLPGQVVKSIGEKSSRASRHYTSNQKKMSEDSIKSFMRTYAEEVFQEKAFDLFIAGHTHVFDEYSFSAEGKEAQAVNLGSWFDVQKCFVIEQNTFGFKDI